MEPLSQRLGRGDRAAFAELYDACADRVHHYLVVRLGSRADADDVLQETFVRVARSGKRLACVEDLAAYVFTVARNEAARFARRSRRTTFKVAPRGRTDFQSVQECGTDYKSVLQPDDLFCHADGDLQAREAAETVAKALAGLDAPLREAVELKVYAGLTFREIAEVTGLPQGTVATRYRAALAKMRTWLVREQ
jgi:RNA polymerase sigma-70 factor, ECF subfamily